MRIPPNRSPLFYSSSILMASLFAYSASVQLNDPDWYFWFPLYASASVVNLVQIRALRFKTVDKIAGSGIWVGFFLFLKVVIEDWCVNGLAGVGSVDLSERVVREKIGSALVVVSMLIYRASSAISNDPPQTNGKESGRYVQYGMGVLVAVSYGLPLIFFVSGKGEVKL